MTKENTNFRPTKKLAAYFIFVWLLITMGILSFCHVLVFGKDYLLNEIIQSLLWGLVIATIATMKRVKEGKQNSRLVNMRKEKYFAFFKISVFFALQILGIIHLFDSRGDYMMSEVLFAVFFGLFCGGVGVLYLIKKDKDSRC